MAATALDRLTQRRFIERTFTQPLKSGVTIPYGVMVACNTPSTGVDNAADTAGMVVLGVSGQRSSTATGDTKALIERGIAKFFNNGSITAANIGQLCFVVDNQTVGMTTTNSIGAGYVDEIEADGVFISMLGGKIAAT